MEDSAGEPGAGEWRRRFITEEVDDARPVAGELFLRRFGHEIPGYPRHFVLYYMAQGNAAQRRVAAYVHQLPHREIYLTGGMCADERLYRTLPRWLFAQVKQEGGLATLVTRDSMAMLGDSPAAFGHVGEPRARQADLRTGFVDTGKPFLMAFWRKSLPRAEQERLIAIAEACCPF